MICSVGMKEETGLWDGVWVERNLKQQQQLHLPCGHAGYEAALRMNWVTVNKTSDCKRLLHFWKVCRERLGGCRSRWAISQLRQMCPVLENVILSLPLPQDFTVVLDKSLKIFLPQLPVSPVLRTLIMCVSFLESLF